MSTELLNVIIAVLGVLLPIAAAFGYLMTRLFKVRADGLATNALVREVAAENAKRVGDLADRLQKELDEVKTALVKAQEAVVAALIDKARFEGDVGRLSKQQIDTFLTIGTLNTTVLDQGKTIKELTASVASKDLQIEALSNKGNELAATVARVEASLARAEATKVSAEVPNIGTGEVKAAIAGANQPVVTEKLPEALSGAAQAAAVAIPAVAEKPVASASETKTNEVKGQV
jgi:hypothetical protein